MRTRVKTFETKEYNGKKSYTVTLENGVCGYLNSQGSDNIGEGNEVDYTLEVKKNKKGGEYNLLTVKLVSETQQKPLQTVTPLPPVSANAPQSNDAVRKIKSEAAIRMMERAMDLFVKENLDWDKMSERQEYVTRLVWGEIDEIYGLK